MYIATPDYQALRAYREPQRHLVNPFDYLLARIDTLPPAYVNGSLGRLFGRVLQSAADPDMPMKYVRDFLRGLQSRCCGKLLRPRLNAFTILAMLESNCLEVANVNQRVGKVELIQHLAEQMNLDFPENRAAYDELHGLVQQAVNVLEQSGDWQRVKDEYDQHRSVAPPRSAPPTRETTLDLSPLIGRREREQLAQARALVGVAAEQNDAEDVVGALNSLTQASALAPHDERITFLLAHALASAGRADEALELLAPLALLHGFDPRFHEAHGNVLRRDGQLEDAVVALERALALDPARLSARVAKGSVLRDLGRALAAADELLGHFLHSSVEIPLSFIPIVISLLQHGAAAAAEANDLDRLFAFTGLCCLLSPASGRYWDQHVHAAMRADRFVDAYQAAIRALDAGAATSATLSMLVRAAEQCDQITSAVARLDQYVAANPELECGWDALGEALFAQGNPYRAYDCYATAIKINSQEARYWSKLGRALIELRPSVAAVEGAVEYIGRALELQPDLAEALYGRSYALMMLSRFAEAEPGLRRLLELEPEFELARTLLNRCGEQLAGTGGPDGAE